MEKYVLALVAVMLAVALAMDGGEVIEPRVVDGDTLYAKDEYYRLWGIDAPEMDTQAGKQAAAALRKHLGDKSLRCHQKDTDWYGRNVVRCFLDGEDIARWLVHQGHAEDWPKYSDGFYKED